jgi:phosphate transport system substrate-binding protein
MDGQYPLSRPLYLYVNKDPKEDWDPKILEFLRFINSREGQETVVRAGIYPLSSRQVSENLAVIENKRLLSAFRQ